MKQGDSNNPIEPIEFRQALFWDVDPKTIDPEKNARYIIEPVLEYGEPNEVGWIFKRYQKNEIKKVIEMPRAQIGPKSKALWSLVLN